MLKIIVSTFSTVMGSSLSQQSAVNIVSHWHSQPAHRLIFDSGRRDVRQYFEAVDRLLHPTLRTLNADLISAAMARLRHEFASVLRRHSDHHPGPASATESSFATDSTAYLRYEDYAAAAAAAAHELPGDDVIEYLRNVARRLSSNGNVGDCLEVYKDVRKSCLQAQLKPLRFEELSLRFNPKRYIWDELRLKMELWVEVCKICVKILFEMEKKLCEQIFQGLGGNYAKDEGFVGTVEEFAFHLFNFAETISLSNQPYERMENILGVYSSFLWVLPSANALFACELGKGVRNKCAQMLCNIENEVVRMLRDFENAVLREISSFMDDRGAVHQSTMYVMDQIAVIVRNKDLLACLIKSAPSLSFDGTVVPREALGDVNGRSFLELHLILIVVVLQKNLEAKSKNYPNPSLGQLFMMNNLRYIVKRIKEDPSNELRKMIGDSYLRKLDENLKFAVDNYVALTCSKFFTCFDIRGLYVRWCFNPRLSKTAVRRRAREFNAAYEEFRFCHSLWTVTDGQLRDEVRVSLKDNLVPAYVNFVEKLRESNGEMDLLLENNIKYSVADFEGLILESLFGNGEATA